MFGTKTKCANLRIFFSFGCFVCTTYSNQSCTSKTNLTGYLSAILFFWQHYLFREAKTYSTNISQHIFYAFCFLSLKYVLAHSPILPIQLHSRSLTCSFLNDTTEHTIEFNTVGYCSTDSSSRKLKHNISTEMAKRIKKATNWILFSIDLIDHCWQTKKSNCDILVSRKIWTLLNKK